MPISGRSTKFRITQLLKNSESCFLAILEIKPINGLNGSQKFRSWRNISAPVLSGKREIQDNTVTKK